MQRGGGGEGAQTLGSEGLTPFFPSSDADWNIVGMGKHPQGSGRISTRRWHQGKIWAVLGLEVADAIAARAVVVLVALLWATVHNPQLLSEGSQDT